ncbi:unnamed protein product [Kluyveromyces dobzhanskii CBS 2104]|uniref:WGS project CCBQ000000000 data, contig 00099 n=1 Tax=Kluyveromyces dobzhanskii CBS 2104 TaxID=1427455 RepID=A0A0A8L4J4_9SACH|nr:unnamed protein product [Kluyveromyces dobzhanskii CBS 2104]
MSKTETQRQPLKDVALNRKRMHSETTTATLVRNGMRSEAYELDQGALTPPHSFVHRSSISESRTPNDKLRKVDPLSPELSSPIKPTRAKRMKSDQGRSSGVNTVEEFLEHLSDASRVVVLQDPSKKPPYSYAMMIVLSILQSDTGKLTLSQIYYWISSHFPYYRREDAGWQNSIRHNLSLNEAFVKGGKSFDGKGHFWEIKPGYESKFFKNDENFSIVDFKSKLQLFKSVALDDGFETGNATSSFAGSSVSSASKSKRKTKAFSNAVVEDKFSDVSDVGDTSIDQSSDCDEERTTLANIPSSPQMADPIETDEDGPRRFSTIDKDYLYYEDENMVKRQESNMLGSSKFSHRHTGIPTADYDDLMGSAMSSPKFKKYTCSFNTSFEPASPMTKLQLPLINQQHSKTPIRESSMTPLKFNIFSTPKDRSKEGLNPPASIRNWQSPSRLFEDYYTSPVFFRNTFNHSIDDCMIQYETEKKCIDSPRKSSLRGQAPSKVLSQTGLMDHSKYSSNGLFGVDVCSVWKRAIAHCSNNDEANETDEKAAKNNLAPPFDGMN